MDQGKIISRAWEITWSNRVLWGLGFLTALASSGGSSSSGVSTDSFNFDPSASDPLPPGFENGPMAELLDGNIDAIATMIAGVAVFLVLAIIIGIVLWFVSQAARAGLITSVVGLQDGQKISFGEAFRGGWNYIGRIFGLKLILFFVPFLLILVVVALVGALIGITESPVAFILFCPISLVLIVLLIGLQFTDAYAFRGIVLKNMGVFESIRHGWGLFRNNIGDNLILGVIYGVIGMVFGFILAFFISIISIFSANPILDFFLTGEISTASIATGTLIGLFITVVSALLGSIIAAWQSTGFTLAYQEMTGMLVEPIGEKSPEDIDAISFDDMVGNRSPREKGPDDIDDGSYQDMI